jgi:large subunit ribosomal protein L1
VPPDDVGRAVGEAKKGRVEYRLDRSAIIHVSIGMASFDGAQLMDNFTTVMDNIVRSRPSGVKGQFIRSAYITTTMGPSIKLDVAGATALREE